MGVASRLVTPLSLLALLGLRVVLVDDLGRDALLIEKASIVLIDASLDRFDLQSIVDQVLRRSAESLDEIAV